MSDIEEGVGLPHTECPFWKGAFMIFSISLSIAVDILQYSMPLPFLSTNLEQEGHSTLASASVVGGYYGMGFLGVACISFRQFWKVVFDKSDLQHTVLSFRAYVFFLILALFVGTLTLGLQFLIGSFHVHLMCRLLQGFFGAFLFFYSYLLSIELFSGNMRIAALTCTSCALNTAEACGPLLGSIIYTRFGEHWVFGFLAVASIIDQILLLQVAYWVPSERVIRNAADTKLSLVTPPVSPRDRGGKKLWRLLTHPMIIRACFLITIAALVKGSVEEIIPYYAQHEWKYDVFQTGLSFMYIAVSYIISSVIIGWLWGIWEDAPRFRDLVIIISLIFLGVYSYLMFVTFAAQGRDFHKLGTRGRDLFNCTLVLYGCSLGFTLTPAAYYLGDYLELLTHSSDKNAANGLWNMVWELGGCVGFFAAASVGTSYYAERAFIGSLSIACFLLGTYLVWLNEQVHTKLKLKNEFEEVDYHTFASFACSQAN